MDNHIHSDSPPPPPSSPSPHMSVPQNQLAMSLLNNLLQMQGLENTILNQQNTPGTTPPASSPNTAQPSYNPQLLLEQQIKLTQLQQLQQLQNQIFQQQVTFFFPFVALDTYGPESDRSYQWSISSYVHRRLYETSESSIGRSTYLYRFTNTRYTVPCRILLFIFFLIKKIRSFG